MLFRSFLLIVLLSSAVAAGEKLQKQTTDSAFFETSVRPTLEDHCFDCHGEDSQESQLRLDSLQAMIDGGLRGAALKPGSASESLMILAVNHGEELQMPEGDKLSVEQIAALTKWVDAGAPGPTRRPFR